LTSEKLWIITEAANDAGNRVATTILLSCESGRTRHLSFDDVPICSALTVFVEEKDMGWLFKCSHSRDTLIAEREECPFCVDRDPLSELVLLKKPASVCECSRHCADGGVRIFATLENENRVPKNVRIPTSFSRRFDRRHTIAGDSRETDGNSVRKTVCRKTCGFPGRSKAHLSAI
jgi:hypothetical protein